MVDRVALLDVSSVTVTPEAGSAWLTKLVPLEISALFKAPGDTVVTAPVAFPITTAFAVNDVTPVPPLPTTSVPAIVIFPEVVIGPPEVVNPVVPPKTSTLVTEPLPVPLLLNVVQSVELK